MELQNQRKIIIFVISLTFAAEAPMLSRKKENEGNEWGNRAGLKYVNILIHTVIETTRYHLMGNAHQFDSLRSTEIFIVRVRVQ